VLYCKSGYGKPLAKPKEQKGSKWTDPCKINPPTLLHKIRWIFHKIGSLFTAQCK